MTLKDLCEAFTNCANYETKREIVAEMILLQESNIEKYARKHFPSLHRMSYEDLKMAAIQRILEVIPFLNENEKDPNRIMAIFFNSMIYSMYDEFRLNDYSCSLNNYARYTLDVKKLSHIFASDFCCDEKEDIYDILSQDINPERTPFCSSPEEQMIKSFELEQLHDLLGRLSEQDKSIILDVFEGEMSFGQIAKKYSLTVSTLYKRKQRILKKLKAMWN